MKKGRSQDLPFSSFLSLNDLRFLLPDQSFNIFKGSLFNFLD